MQTKAARKAVYPGTFDPVTLGHLDVIERSLKLFDEIVVGVTTNPKKEEAFPLKERIKLIEENIREREWKSANGKNVAVKPFDSLLVDFAKAENAATIIRGLRELSDFTEEFQYAIVNRKLAPEIETVFIMTDARYFYLRSSTAKEIARYGGALERFVPKNVETALRARFGTR